MKIVRHDDLPDRPVSHDAAIPKRVLLGRGDAPGLTHFARARFARGQKAAAHVHADLWEVFWVESGEGVARIAGAEHLLSAGSCLLVEPGDEHEIEATGEQGLVLVYFGLEGEPPGTS